MTSLKFNDPPDWLNKRISGVVAAYKIPQRKTKMDIAVDIGANVGAFEIVNHDKFNRIICVEPSAHGIQQLHTNTANFDNVSINKLAVDSVSDLEVKLMPYKSGNTSGNASTQPNDLWDDSVCEIVKTISLEDIFTKFNIDRINYLKIDCECSEYNFLMNKDLSRIDYMAIEIHIQLGNKLNELETYLLNTFTIISELGDGITSHRELTLVNKTITGSI